MNRMILGLTVFLLLPVQAQAANFFTSFENQNQRTAGSFTVSDGGLSATFEGGTAFTIGNTALYRSGDVSWMLDPQGTNTRGTSTGVGDVTLSEPAERVKGYIRTENAVAMARMQVIDASGAVVREVGATNTGWTEVAHQVTAGEARITRLRFLNDGGGMAALDDFEFATDAASAGGGGGGGSGGLNAWLLALLAGLGLSRRVAGRRTRCR